MTKRQPALVPSNVGEVDRGALISRREAMRCGLAGAAGALLADRQALGGPTDAQPPKAKSVIQIWMWGGPSHLDTFDPKPEAGYDYCGPLASPISTNVDGVRIGELLPLLAKQADKYSIIRSMTHGYDGHETATYLVQTGRKPGGRLVYPGVGAVVSLLKGYDSGYEGLIPPYILLTKPLGRFSEAGFLGSRYKPFSTGGDPALPKFMVEGVVAQGITDEQQRERREFLHQLDRLGPSVKDNAAMTAYYQSQEQAYDMIVGDGAKVFDLSQEKDELRDRYGLRWVGNSARSTFGQCCLVARRLVERGVPFITINYLDWDTHKSHFQAMQQNLPELDKGLATLLEDLSERGLLDSTIIWWGGEFGRTPKVAWEAPWNGGRHHYGRVFSALVAGGGFKGGCVVGASDAKGEEVKDRPVYPCDVMGSIYELMGIDPDGQLPNPLGLDLTLTPSAAEGIPMAGRLKEIM